MNTYTKYRESGIPWLGKIPEHWEVRKLKYVSSVILSSVDKKSEEGENPVRLCNYVDVYYNDSITPELDFMEATASPDEVESFDLQAGDVLITKDSESWDDIAIPAYIPATLDGVICGYHLARIRPRSSLIDGRFLFLAFKAGGINHQYRVAANGITRYGLGKYWIDNSNFPLPPIEEQRAIASFLDRETGRIDELVGRKERLIELLREKRQALISHAVTHGLNSNAPLKDSGIPWLGEIPEHWEVPPLYARYSVKLGKMLDEKQITGKHLMSYLRNTDVQWDYVNTTNLPLMDFDEKDRHNFSLKPNDLLVCEGGEVGRTAMWRGELEECSYQKAIHRIRPRTDQYNPRFLYYVMQMAANRGVFVAGANPNTFNHLTAEKLRRHRFAFPPKVEQDEIAAYLDKESKEIDKVIGQILQGIYLLNEYRTALISAAVTGKIDVREEQAEAKPVRLATPEFKRTVLAAEIAHQLHEEPTFGRVKLQKLLYLCEHHAKLPEMKSNYFRDAAGPFDNRMMRSVEKQMEAQKWFRRVTRDQELGYSYVPMERAGGHREYFDRYWSDRAEVIHYLINLFRPATTAQCEIAATLYAAWNDLIIKNLPIDDQSIIREARQEWHEAKMNIPEGRWIKALPWMRQKGLVPSGFGHPTKPKKV